MVGGIENEGESMPRTRKSHPPSLKAKVAVEAIKAHKTAAQIAQMFGVHPTQVGGWKKQALAGLSCCRHAAFLSRNPVPNGDHARLCLKCPPKLGRMKARIRGSGSCGRFRRAG